MNRATLFALAAALLAAHPAAYAAQPAAPNEAAWARAVNLLPLIDPANDAVKGEWKMEGGKLISDRSRQARIQIPYEPPADYDFRIVFVCSEGVPSVTQFITHSGQCAFWIMGGPSSCSFPGAKSKRMEYNPQKYQFGSNLEFNHEYTSVLRVRDQGVAAYLDGKLINRWTTDYTDAKVVSTWELPTANLLAVGSDGTLTTFVKIDILEIRGKGKARSQPNRNAAVAPVAPSPAATDTTMTTSTGMELVWIPPGEFMLGSTAEERAWALANGATEKNVKAEGEKPRKTVIKHGFWMGRTAVTIGQWKKFVSATGYMTDGEKKGSSFAPQGRGKPWAWVNGASWKNLDFGFRLGDNHPVTCLSWNDAAAFCEWLMETEKKTNKLPVGMICRLPSEAEREYACRAGKQTRFWWSDSQEGAERRLNWNGTDDGFESLSPVDYYGRLGRNGFGLADMLGGVREWCLDGWDENGAHGELWTGNQSVHMVRGGGFLANPGSARCASRAALGASNSSASDGLRVCCGIPEGSGEPLDGSPVVANIDAVKKTGDGKPTVASIADPSLQKDAKKFAKNQSSSKGLYVVHTETGLRMGSAQDIIATAERVGNNLETICDFTGEVAKDTQISMEEAERLLKVRYPVWQAGYKIRFSYANKYAKQAGGSAGGAFSVLLLSLLDGMQIDPAFAMTGDVTVDGKIREVGAVAEKIRGAALEKCRIVAIPLANKESLADLALLYSPAMLWNVQIFSIATLDEAAAVARQDRSENLTKALALFAEAQSRLLPTAMKSDLGPTGAAMAMHHPQVNQLLREVLRLAPNHLSAEFMLRLANNQFAPTLTLETSLDEIWNATGPLLPVLLNKEPSPTEYHRFKVTKIADETIKTASARLAWLHFRIHPKTRDLKLVITEYITTLTQMVNQPATISRQTFERYLAMKEKVFGEATKIGTDRKALEELMH